MPRGAGTERIRDAYRALALRFHPDRNAGGKETEERFKDINRAYEVLSDPEQRAAYDQRDGAADDSEGGLGGFFAGMFDRARRFGPAPRRGPDVRVETVVTLREALRGTERRVGLVTARIPPGVRTGTLLRVPGAGGPSEEDGEPGDLYVSVRVEADPGFRVEGDDLVSPVGLSLSAAVLGGDIEIPGPDRPIFLRVPPGTEPGTLLRVRGAGLPKAGGGGRGDLLVRVSLKIPKVLSPEQRRLFERLAEQDFGARGG